MKVIRKIFKDYGISFVMILNFMLIFLLIINVIRLDEKRRTSQADKDKYKFDYIYEMSIAGVNDDNYIKGFKPEKLCDDVYETVIQFNGNVIRTGYFYMESKNDLVTTGIIECVLKNDEDIKFDSIDGKVVTYEPDSKASGVYIHELFTKNTYEKDGVKYINFNGAALQVDGIKKDYSLDCSDTCSYVFANGLDDEQKKYMLYDYDNIDLVGEIDIRFESNFDRKNEIDDIKNILKNKGYYVSVNNSSSDDKKDNFDFTKDLSTIIYYILIIFSLVNCVYISDIWALRQQKEMIIRKTFGQSMKIISLNIFFEMIIKIVIAIIAVVIIQTLITGSISIADFRVREFAYILGSIIIISLINIAGPIIRIKKIEPAVGIKKI